MPRPHLHYFLVILLLIPLAGCATPFFSTPAEEAEASSLGSVGVRNTDTEPHSLDVLIERNGTIAYWTTVHVDAAQGDTLGSTVIAAERFVDRPGDYVIKARLDDRTNGSAFSLSSVATSGCTVVHIRIEDDETLTFGTADDAYECQSG